MGDLNCDCGDCDCGDCDCGGCNLNCSLGEQCLRCSSCNCDGSCSMTDFLFCGLCSEGSYCSGCSAGSLLDCPTWSCYACLVMSHLFDDGYYYSNTQHGSTAVTDARARRHARDNRGRVEHSTVCGCIPTRLCSSREAKAWWACAFLVFFACGIALASGGFVVARSAVNKRACKSDFSCSAAPAVWIYLTSLSMPRRAIPSKRILPSFVP